MPSSRDLSADPLDDEDPAGEKKEGDEGAAGEIKSQKSTKKKKGRGRKTRTEKEKEEEPPR